MLTIREELKQGSRRGRIGIKMHICRDKRKSGGGEGEVV